MSSEATRRGLTSQIAVIFFVSAGALLFQVAQTRLFSAVFGYHLTYLVISVSLLGVGWGATLSAVFDARSRRPSLGQLGLGRSEEHTSELQSRLHLVCRLLLEKKKQIHTPSNTPPAGTQATNIPHSE